MPQISDQELAELRQKRYVEQTLFKNPTVKKKFYELYKEADPNAVIPELTQMQAEEADRNERDKKIQDEIKEIRRVQLQRDAEELDRRDRERLTRPPFNLTQEEIDEVIKYQAVAHQNGQLINLEYAARCWRDEHSIPGQRNGPRLAFSTRDNRPKNDFRKEIRNPNSELFKDPRGYVAKQADEARKELIEHFGQSLV